MQQDRHYEDQIDLISIFQILWKRKKLIVLGTLLLTFSAAGGSFLLPNVYEVTAILEPGTRPITNNQGQIVDEKTVVPPETIREVVLGGAYDWQIQKKLNIPVAEFPEFKVYIPKKTSLIKFSIESRKPTQAVAVLNELVAQISTGIQERLEIEKKGIENEIELARINSRALDSKIELINKQIAETGVKIKDLEKNRQVSMASSSADAMSVLLYSSELQTKQIYLNGLQEKLKNLEAQAEGSDVRIDSLRLKLASVKSNNINKEPSVPPRPKGPKKLFIVFLMFFAGLVGMILLALILDYVKRYENHNRLSTSN